MSAFRLLLSIIWSDPSLLRCTVAVGWVTRRASDHKKTVPLVLRDFPAWNRWRKRAGGRRGNWPTRVHPENSH